MKVELSEILKIVAGLGGTDASDEYNKGWDKAKVVNLLTDTVTK